MINNNILHRFFRRVCGGKRMRVELLAYTPEAQVIVASAAKLCYSAADIDAIMEKQTPEETERFLATLVDMGHESPIEHAYFTFAIEGVSRALLAQITRHRIASFSVQSQRYVRENAFDYVIPPRVEKCPEAMDEFEKAMKSAQESYDKIAAALAEAEAEELVKNGIDPVAAKKAAGRAVLEDARFVLPNACDTKMILTMNARSLMNFFELRCCERAQWEIRAVATKMLELVRKACPTLFKNAGPGCLKGACPEKKMCCGKAAQVREKFAKLGEM